MAGADDRHYLSQWRAAASPGGLVGLLLISLSALVVAGMALGITGRADVPAPDALLWVVLGLAALAGLVCAFLFWGYISIRYELDPQHLRIRWAMQTHTLFLDDIVFIGPVVDTPANVNRGWQPFWPGYYKSTLRTAIGPMRVIATLPPRRQIMIVLNQGQRYAISPERPILFLEEFDRLRRSLDQERAEVIGEPPEQSPAQRLLDAGWTGEFSAVSETHAPAAVSETHAPAHVATGRPAARPASAPPPVTRVARAKPSATSPLLRPIILTDPVAMALLVLGVLTTAAMAIFIFVRFNDVPPSITLHWNVEGLPGRVGTSQEIWILPIICGLVLIANFGLAWSIALFDRFAARLLLGSTIVVHVVAWVALMMILG